MKEPMLPMTKNFLTKLNNFITIILSLVFNFNYDNEKTSYKISSPDGKSIVFDLFNFNNILGTGLKQPIEIANYKGKKLFAIFFVYKHKDANPILDISLYQEM